MKLAIFKETRTRLPVAQVNRLFEMITDEEADSDRDSRINLIFTTDRRIRALNREFRSQNRATDVLAFSIDPPDLPGGVLGEVYICAPGARRQARNFGNTLWKEYLRLVCHGLLHLFGYDHVNDRESRKMDRRQIHFLSQLEGEKGR